MADKNPYHNARREWDERYGDLIAQKRNWQRAAVGSIGIAFLSILGMAYVGSQSKIQPFVVVADQLGFPVAVARPAPVAKVDFDQRLMIAQLAAFIKDARQMLPDPVAQQVSLDRIYAMAGRDAAQFMNNHYEGKSPFSLDGTIVRIEITSVLHQGGDTYQVDWVETVAKPGATPLQEQWKAIVTVATDPKLAENPKVALWNPFGIYIKSVNWTKEVH
jgi:type IV secretory pathway TrbF-like protein